MWLQQAVKLTVLAMQCNDDLTRRCRRLATSNHINSCRNMLVVSCCPHTTNYNACHGPVIRLAYAYRACCWPVLLSVLHLCLRTPSAGLWLTLLTALFFCPSARRSRCHSLSPSSPSLITLTTYTQPTPSEPLAPSFNTPAPIWPLYHHCPALGQVWRYAWCQAVQNERMFNQDQ